MFVFFEDNSFGISHKSQSGGSVTNEVFFFMHKSITLVGAIGILFARSYDFVKVLGLDRGGPRSSTKLHQTFQIMLQHKTVWQAFKKSLKDGHL